MNDKIEKIEQIVGLAHSYVDVCNQTVNISQEHRINALKAMGYATDDEDRLSAQIKEKELKPYADIVDPVCVIRDDDFNFIYIYVSEDTDENAVFAYEIQLEDGTLIKRSMPLYEVEIASYKELYGQVYDRRRLILDTKLPHGYHTFSCSIDDGREQLKSINMSLICTPVKCYMPECMEQGQRLWGVSVQLYSLRSKENWGIGDFGDLKSLVKHIARSGGHFIGLNPLHAGYPANPDPDMISPYSPSSRQWLNIIYIRVEDIPEFNTCKKAISAVQEKGFKQKLRALRDREYVDYRQVLVLKLQILRLLFDNVRVDDRRTIRGRKFIEFMQKHGDELINMATYDALQAHYYAKGVDAWGWQKFDKEFDNAASPFVAQWRKDHEDDVRFYAYLQFIADEQLHEAFEISKKEGMILGLYRDLAVGVSKGSCDVWSDTDRVYRDASVGAPPDPLGPIGQSWGLSPMDPDSLKMAAYRPLINLYRQNMKSCGAMRIDHAAGLYRMWWVPLGENASEGAYVNYSMHDLLGIIALESVRSRCLIIAEDLGTIPQQLREELKKVGALSYKLFFGEIAHDGGFIAPKDYQSVAMSAITTHDMPTLVGWWGNGDLTLGQKLGLYTPEQAEKIGHDRNISKQRILDSLHGLHSVGSEVPYRACEIESMTEDLCLGLQVHMCRGSCLLYSSQLEDWTFVATPVNVPGTFREYPNWRRKLTLNIDEIFEKKFVSRLTAAMSAARDE